MRLNFERKNKGGEGQSQKDAKILPSDVRYALQYKEALLNKDEIETLNDNYFENEALYLTLKGLQDNPEEQKILLERYVGYVLKKTKTGAENKPELREIIRESLESLGQGSVQGGKLAQLSRQGFEFWQEKFEQKAIELSKDKRNVFLVANAMLLGLGSFVKNFSETSKPLGIIIPKWLNEGAHIVGYTINFKDGEAEVDFLKKNSYKDQAVTVLVDDATNSGKVFAKIKEYWTRNGFKEPDTIAIASIK